MILALIGRPGHEYATDPEVGRYCYFAVESPLSGWRKTSRYHAEKTKIPTAEHRTPGRINQPAVVAATAAASFHFRRSTK